MAGWNSGCQVWPTFGSDIGAPKAFGPSVWPKLARGPKASWVAAVSWPCAARDAAVGLLAMALAMVALCSGVWAMPMGAGPKAFSAAELATCSGVAIAAAIGE